MDEEPIGKKEAKMDQQTLIIMLPYNSVFRLFYFPWRIFYTPVLEITLNNSRMKFSMART
jgi:hypothetical protein